MRKELKQILIENIPEIQSRVYEPSAAGPDLIKPFVVLREGVQSPDQPFADYTTIYEVWPYVDYTTFNNVDSLSKQVITTLDKIRFNVEGVPHYIEFAGSLTEDVVDDEWDVLTRGLRFQVYSLAWLLHIPIEPDPVVAMKEWTEKHFMNVQTNPNTWDPQDDKPALYWRQVSIQSVESMNWGSWINARLNGHIIIPNVAKRKEWTEKVVRQLAIDTKTTMSDNSRIGFLTVSADSGYNPFNQGQIQLDVRYGILKEKIEHEEMKIINTGPYYGGVNLGKEK